MGGYAQRNEEKAEREGSLEVGMDVGERKVGWKDGVKREDLSKDANWEMRDLIRGTCYAPSVL